MAPLRFAQEEDRQRRMGDGDYWLTTRGESTAMRQQWNIQQLKGTVGDRWRQPCRPGWTINQQDYSTDWLTDRQNRTVQKGKGDSIENAWPSNATGAVKHAPRQSRPRLMIVTLESYLQCRNVTPGGLGGNRSICRYQECGKYKNRMDRTRSHSNAHTSHTRTRRTVQKREQDTSLSFPRRRRECQSIIWRIWEQTKDMKTILDL